MSIDYTKKPATAETAIPSAAMSGARLTVPSLASGQDIVDEMRDAQRLYEAAGVDGCEGARMMKIGADEIERLRASLDRIRSSVTRSLDQKVWHIANSALESK